MSAFKNITPYMMIKETDIIKCEFLIGIVFHGFGVVFGSK